jgi:hypothetical protein
MSHDHPVFPVSRQQYSYYKVGRRSIQPPHTPPIPPSSGVSLLLMLCDSIILFLIIMSSSSLIHNPAFRGSVLHYVKLTTHFPATLDMVHYTGVVVRMLLLLINDGDAKQFGRQNVLLQNHQQRGKMKQKQMMIIPPFIE